MNLPKDPVMLLSVVNTLLRDRFSTLEALCADCGITPAALSEALAVIDYHYDPEQNQFK